MAVMASLNPQDSNNAMNSKPIVYLLEDDSAVRESIQWLLEKHGIEVRAFANPRDFLEAYDENWVGCLILDLALPEMNGLEVYRKLLDRGTQLPFIVITGHGEIPDATQAMKLGAIDFLEKPYESDRLVALVRQALRLSERRHQAKAMRRVTQDQIDSLTPRELQIMDLMVEGLMTKQIARRLDISIKTVEAHRSSILKKMKVESVVQLVRVVTQHRLLAETVR